MGVSWATYLLRFSAFQTLECVCDKSCRLRGGLYPAKGLDCVSSGATVGNPSFQGSLTQEIACLTVFKVYTYLLLVLLYAHMNAVHEGYREFVIRLENLEKNKNAREKYSFMVVL